MAWNLWDDDEETIFERHDDHLIYRASEFNEDLVEDLKNAIPARYREWDGEVWHIDLRYEATVIRLHRDYIGEAIELAEMPEEAIDAGALAWPDGVEIGLDPSFFDNEGEPHDPIA